MDLPDPRSLIASFSYVYSWVLGVRDSYLSWVKKITGGQNFLFWLESVQSTKSKQFLAALGFFVLFGVVMQSFLLGFAMLVSMYTHELGHLVAFIYYKIKAKVRLLFPIGAVAMPADAEENRRSDLLHWNKISWVLNAGPMVNVLLMVFWSLVAWVRIPYLNEVANAFVYVNGLLAILNLIPVWHLDAGQLFHVIFSSLREREDRIVATFLTGLFLAFVFYLGFSGYTRGGWWVFAGTLLSKYHWLTFLLVLAVGAWHKQRLDNESHSESVQAMSLGQVAVHLTVYTAMVVTSLWIFAGSPLL